MAPVFNRCSFTGQKPVPHQRDHEAGYSPSQGLKMAALKGHNNSAQGNALGLEIRQKSSPERATDGMAHGCERRPVYSRGVSQPERPASDPGSIRCDLCRPFRAWIDDRSRDPGRCPGLSCCALSGQGGRPFGARRATLPVRNVELFRVGTSGMPDAACHAHACLWHAPSDS